MVYELAQEARKLTAQGFSIIPLKNKVAIIKYDTRRKKLATTREIDLWFSNGNGNGRSRTKGNSIAIAINTSEFGIDTDGEKCELIFRNKIIPRLSSELQDKVNRTMQTKTPHGYHRTFKFIQEDLKDGIKERVIIKFDGHNEISVIGKNHYFVERGSGYEIVNDVDYLVTLSKSEVSELLQTLDSFKVESNAIKTIIGVLVPHYKEPARHSIALHLSGFLHKARVPGQLIHEIISRLAAETNDPEISDRLRAVNDTLQKSPDSEGVSGYSALLEALDNDKGAIAEIEQIFSELAPDNFRSQKREENEPAENELRGVSQRILTELSPFVCAVVSLNPPVMYVAHSGWRCIIKAFVRFETETTTTNDGNNTIQEKRTKKQILQWKYKYIYAVPTKVIVNKNPLNGNKTYQVTFAEEGSRNEFIIGPCSINSIIEELASSGKVYKKAEAIDAFTVILNKYEKLGLAEINESITTQGYYYIKDKFEYHDITQVIDKEPSHDDVLKCIEFLNELSTRWHNLDIFPTVIKWFILAPFDYIFKIAANRWLTNFHPHGWSSSGKTSLGKIGLAIWRLHTLKHKGDFQLGFSNIDNAARLGYVISNSTYPKLINEVGASREKNNRPLLELVKQSVESLHVRGKFVDGKYQNIPALCKLFMTSNPRPPDDSGYRSRTTIVHHGKEDVHERRDEETKEFEKWFESRLHLLGVLGDFVARYVIVKPLRPEDSILFSTDRSYDDMAREIISAFYSSVGKDRPDWLDRTCEQRSIVEENTEQAYFEIRSFLIKQITDAYSRYFGKISSDKDPDRNVPNNIDFRVRLNFCLANKLIPYLHEFQNEEYEGINISHDILTGLHKEIEHLEGITTMEDLAKELPGFEYKPKKVNKQTRRVLSGRRSDFLAFLEGDIEEIGQDHDQDHDRSGD